MDQEANERETTHYGVSDRDQEGFAKVHQHRKTAARGQDVQYSTATANVVVMVYVLDIVRPRMLCAVGKQLTTKNRAGLLKTHIAEKMFRKTGRHLG